MNESCKNCKYFHQLKDFSNGQWKMSSVCTFFPQTEKGYEAFAIVTTESDMCECYTKMRDDK